MNKPVVQDIFCALYGYFCATRIQYRQQQKGRDTMAKSTTSNISIRMDSDLKAAAEALYEELGMNLSTAFNIFVRQSP